MADNAGEAAVENNESEGRFEIRSGGLVGVLAYELAGDEIVLTHTEVNPEMEGRGMAALLAKGALEYARERGLKVVPLCSYVATYIRRHPEYRPLLREA
ncbi:MAG TPA: GNAT family N-acetyltransferase [Pyrinomonadaceae bacterium]|jgi:hypothetical protein